ncbi:hypothetical protein [Methylocapsa sp. S129]|uniref:hypothetical protein n=1 Tax=Methylocapsa sp. S129 TaxID=1641869 RepID=UPI00131E4E73|nr:hypothetical protein [Methylocapsa sp. S129]
MTAEAWTLGLTDAALDAVKFRRAFASAFLAAVLIAGLAVRILVANDPLWIDEIWSIQNLAPLTHFWQVFWGVSHDNNHFLNSLWLYFTASPTANALVLRAPAVAMSVATIPLMARLGARHSPAAAMAAGALMAASYFFVDYGAVARGYAGAALALVIAFDALERAIPEPASPQRFALAAAAGIGALCHLAIAPAIGLYALICLGEQKRRLGGWGAALAATFRIFWPSLLALLPALAFVVAGAFVMGGFTIGKIDAYDPALALKAMMMTVFSTLGLPVATPLLFLAIACPLAIVAALRSGLISADRRIAYAIILLALPASVFLLQPPNSDVPRYYLICALFLILLVAEVFGGLWRVGGWRRFAALLALAAMLTGSANLLVRQQESMEGAWPNALAAIAASDATDIATTFDSNFDKFIVFFNESHSPKLTLIAQDQWCARNPQWLVTDFSHLPMPPEMALEANGCRLRFDLQSAYAAGGFAPTAWALYRLRRAGEASPHG